MGHEDFHQLLAAVHDDCQRLMYQYGYACGLQNAINFSQIKQSFSNLKLSKTEEKDYLKEIVDGFRSTSDFDLNLFFG